MKKTLSLSLTDCKDKIIFSKHDSERNTSVGNKVVYQVHSKSQFCGSNNIFIERTKIIGNKTILSVSSENKDVPRFYKQHSKYLEN